MEPHEQKRPDHPVGQGAARAGIGGAAMSQWLAMGGYGAYVWASFALTAAGLVWMSLAASRARRNWFRNEDEDQ